MPKKFDDNTATETSYFTTAQLKKGNPRPGSDTSVQHKAKPSKASKPKANKSR